jgi:hypothetical protein
MENDKTNQLGGLITRGRHTSASYLRHPIITYRGNPFIEALPPIKTDVEAAEALGRYPSHDPAERQMPTHLRLHRIQNASQSFVPLPVHLDVHQRFSRMICAGYQHRNPVAVGHWKRINKSCESLAKSTSIARNSAQSVPLGFTIFGFPGVGKSTSVEAVLSLYPQVVYHSNYGRRDFHVAQIVWLKLECPFDGSAKGLCLSFFQAIDQLLGTTYERNYGSGRRTTDELLLNMARVAAIHGLGVLVIDEINRLSGCKGDGAIRLLSFFVQLTNSIGVPVVLVGTYKAKRVLTGEFHQIRRGTGQGDLVWDRMEEGEWIEATRRNKLQSRNPGAWQFFIESIWIYQYTRVACPLTKDLAHVLYEETQGITDFAVKVYMLAQIRAITTARKPSDEVITADIIRSVARDSLKLAQPVLTALRTGNSEYLQTVPDINPLVMDDFIQAAQTALTNNKTPGNEKPTPYGKSGATKKSTNRKTKARRSKKPNTYDDADLRAASSNAQSSNESVYEELRKAGHIGGIAESSGNEGAA